MTQQKTLKTLANVCLHESSYVEAAEELEVLEGLAQRVHLVSQPEVSEADVEEGGHKDSK